MTQVHNHGTEEGEGLACPETRLLGGQLMGKCVYEEFASMYEESMPWSEFVAQNAAVYKSSEDKIADLDPKNPDIWRLL